jgi:hypothetical protein
MSPAIGHTVKTATDVAATFHLEPNHNPKAGEPATVWFALTKAGGQPIPLSDCDCQLTVKQGADAIATVPLKAITAEQYQGIPGGEMVFPKVGIYQLIFSGKAKAPESFQPFELKYEVTVQPGKAVAETPVSPKSGENSIGLHFHPVVEISPIVPGLIGAIALAGVGYWLVRGRDR